MRADAHALHPHPLRTAALQAIYQHSPAHVLPLLLVPDTLHHTAAQASTDPHAPPPPSAPCPLQELSNETLICPTLPSQDAPAGPPADMSALHKSDKKQRAAAARLARMPVPPPQAWFSPLGSLLTGAATGCMRTPQPWLLPAPRA